MLTMKQTFACVLLFLAVQASETCATSTWKFKCQGSFYMEKKDFSKIVVKKDITEIKFKKVCCDKKTYENCTRNAKELHGELLETPKNVSTIQNLNEQITCAIREMNLEFEYITLKSHNAICDELWKNGHNNEYLQKQDLKFSVNQYRRHEKQVNELRTYLSVFKGKETRELKQECSKELDKFGKKLKMRFSILKTELQYDFERVRLVKLANTFENEVAEAIKKDPDYDPEFKKMLRKVTLADVSEIVEKSELETMKNYLDEYKKLKKLNANPKLPYYADGLKNLHSLIEVAHVVHSGYELVEVGYGLGAVAAHAVVGGAHAAVGGAHATVGGVLAGAMANPVGITVGIVLTVLGGVISVIYKFAQYAKKKKLEREDRMKILKGFVTNTYWCVYNVRKVTSNHEKLTQKIKKDADAHFESIFGARTETKIARTDTELSRNNSGPNK